MISITICFKSGQKVRFSSADWQHDLDAIQGAMDGYAILSLGPLVINGYEIAYAVLGEDGS